MFQIKDILAELEEIEKQSILLQQRVTSLRWKLAEMSEQTQPNKKKTIRKKNPDIVNDVLQKRQKFLARKYAKL